MKTNNNLSKYVKTYIKSSIYNNNEVIDELIDDILLLTLNNLIATPLPQKKEKENIDNIWLKREFLLNIYKLVEDIDYKKYIIQYIQTYNIFYEEFLDKNSFKTIEINEELSKIDIAKIAIHLSFLLKN